MDSYDFVIVGGGTAGCVLAARLSENPQASVLLLEAGAAQSPAGAEVPPAWPTLLESPANWGDVAACQTAARRPVAIARGRALGGGSAINAMVFMRGHRSSYDRWPKKGADGWGFDDLLPFFRRTETANGHDAALRGTDGPLIVGPPIRPNPVLAACLDATAEVGYRRADDISGGLEEGFGWTDLNIVDGRRQSAADAYLRPVMRRGNLRVVTGALAHRLLIEQQKCTGVEYSTGGEAVQVRANNEVVVTAGTIGTPKLLMLSGIGPVSALLPHGIAVIADLPGVGENLHDHPYAFVIYRPAQPVPSAANNHGEALGLLRSDPALDYPDLQILFVDIPLVPPSAGGPGSGYTIAASPMQPFSRGAVRLASGSPDAAPVVDPRYLSDPRDVQAMVTGLKIAREIGRAGALTPWRAEEVLPGPGADTDEALRHYADTAMESYFHPVGTCRIGTDAMSVVDPELRVHGISGLRIADASVMPSIVSGNTNATVYAIAELAATLIGR
jgi:choline dehydrogenase-like flavoprotein